jgi:ATP-dependent protease ClpP protease subunit
MTKSNLDKNVFIIIDSIGGDLIEGVNLINWMEESKIKNNLRFECICIRTISTAFAIYQFCDYRYIIDSCLMIQHEPKINIEGTFDFVSNYYQNNFQVHLNMYKLLVEKISNRLNMDIIEYKNKINSLDWIIFNNNEMLQNNLADKKI